MRNDESMASGQPVRNGIAMASGTGMTKGERVASDDMVRNG